MDIANNVKKRIRIKQNPVPQSPSDSSTPPVPSAPSVPTKERMSNNSTATAKKKTVKSKILAKSKNAVLFKQRQKVKIKGGNKSVPALQKKNPRNVNKTGKISVLSLINKKKKTVVKEKEDSPGADQSTTKPSYRTRNAATLAYLDSLQVVRRTLAPKKLIKPINKKTSRDSEEKPEEFPALTPKKEVISVSRILANGLWFKVGDIISVYGDEEAKSKVYYAQIRSFLRDQFCEQYASVRWLIPASKKRKNLLAFSFSPFDFDNYLEGPEHDEPINMNDVNFVAHARGSSTFLPEINGIFPYRGIYKDREGLKILDVPSATATSIDYRYRNPFI